MSRPQCQLLLLLPLLCLAMLLLPLQIHRSLRQAHLRLITYPITHKRDLFLGTVMRLKTIILSAVIHPIHIIPALHLRETPQQLIHLNSLIIPMAPRRL
jgi:hypothetical protein